MKISRSVPPESCQFDFIVSEEGGCYTQEVLDRGGRIHKIPLRTKDPLSAFGSIRRIVRDNQYDVVLKLGENALASVDLVAARLGGAKILALRSCNAPTGMSRLSKGIHAALRPLANAVTTVKLAPSTLAAEFMFGKRAARRDVHLLHNGVDLTIFRYNADGRQKIREEFSLTDRLVVGHIGRFHRQKNHLFLLEVFARLREFRQDAVLLLVGIGDLERSVREHAEKLGISDSVIFAGQRFDIPQLLSAMDVFVFPSFHEGMPNTVIEAQATGLPCVIADTITREADITGLVQYLSLEQSPECWAQTALSAVTEEWPNTAQAFLDKGYDIKQVAEELMQLLGC